MKKLESKAIVNHANKNGDGDGDGVVDDVSGTAWVECDKCQDWLPH